MVCAIQNIVLTETFSLGVVSATNTSQCCYRKFKLNHRPNQPVPAHSSGGFSFAGTGGAHERPLAIRGQAPGFAAVAGLVSNKGVVCHPSSPVEAGAVLCVLCSDWREDTRHNLRSHRTPSRRSVPVLCGAVSELVQALPRQRETVGRDQRLFERRRRRRMSSGSATSVQSNCHSSRGSVVSISKKGSALLVHEALEFAIALR